MSTLIVSIGKFRSGEPGYVLNREGFSLEAFSLGEKAKTEDCAAKGVLAASNHCRYSDHVVLETSDRVFYKQLRDGRNLGRFVGLLDSIDALAGTFQVVYTQKPSIERYSGEVKEMELVSIESAFDFED